MLDTTGRTLRVVWHNCASLPVCLPAPPQARLEQRACAKAVYVHPFAALEDLSGNLDGSAKRGERCAQTRRRIERQPVGKLFGGKCAHALNVMQNRPACQIGQFAALRVQTAALVQAGEETSCPNLEKSFRISWRAGKSWDAIEEIVETIAVLCDQIVPVTTDIQLLPGQPRLKADMI